MSATLSSIDPMATLSVGPTSAVANQTDANWQGWDTIYVPSERMEHIMFYTVAGINLINIPIIIYSICYRNYLPIKAKNVWITTGIGIGGIVYNFAFNVCLGIIGYKGWYQPCRVWGAWLFFTLGMGLILSLVNTRLVFYYRIFISRRTHVYKHFTLWKFIRRWYPFFIFWLPTLFSSILVEVIPDTFSVRSILDHGVRTCDWNFNYLYWVFTYYGAQIVVAWCLYFRMRKIAKAFNEFSMAMWTLLFYTIVLTCMISINCAKGSVYAWGRISQCIINAVLFNMHYWLITIPPIVGHIFYREKALKKFLSEMHEDGLIAQQAHLGNAHHELYGVEDGTDTYIDADADERTKWNANAQRAPSLNHYTVGHAGGFMDGSNREPASAPSPFSAPSSVTSSKRHIV
ncbi:hypothetical protein GGI12_004278 [Dipsacomyces acuminosporus]|nr:hypothetical protein GGI12_004278 [Dipsacomyces acuminosporus]